MSDNKSIRLDEDSKSYKDLEESLCIPKQTLTVKNNDDNSSLADEKEINLGSNLSLKLNNNENNENIGKKPNQNNKIKEKKAEKNKITLGNVITSLILEKKKNITIHLKIDKEKSSKKGYTVHEISKIIENKESNIEKNILCYRRYDNFSSLFELLEVKYPHYVFPSVPQKNPSINNINIIKETMKKDDLFLEKRKTELEYFINEVYNHRKIGKGEEIKKFLNETSFDKNYFQNLINYFDYPESMKQINNKGLIGKGIESITNTLANTYNYYMGKSNSEKKNGIPKKFMEIKEKVVKKLEKYRQTSENIRDIYECLKEENKEKASLNNNLLTLKNENDKENDVYNNFKELIGINQEFNNNDKDNCEEELKFFEIKIVNPLNFSLLDLEGEKKAIERYEKFWENYNCIINYKIGDNDSKIILEEQNKIKNDIKIYEEVLDKELERAEENNIKIYNEIIHNLSIFLQNNTRIFIEKYKNCNAFK